MDATDVGALFTYAFIAFIGFAIVLVIAAPAVHRRNSKEKRLKRENRRLWDENEDLKAQLKDSQKKLAEAYRWDTGARTRPIYLVPTQGLPHLDGRTPVATGSDEQPSG